MAIASTLIAPAHSKTEPLFTQPMAEDHSANTDSAKADTAKTNTAKTDIDALATAVERNDIPSVKQLIKNKVDLRPANWYDTPVLVTAAEKGFFEIVQFLVTARANVNNGYDRLALHSAAENGHLPIVRCLLEFGAYPEAQDSRGYTAFVAAAAAGQLDVVRLLIPQIENISSAEVEQAINLAAKGQHQSVCTFIREAFGLVQPEPVVPVQKPKIMSVADELIEKSVAELNQTLLSDADDTV